MGTVGGKDFTHKIFPPPLANITLGNQDVYVQESPFSTPLTQYVGCKNVNFDWETGVETSKIIFLFSVR